MIYKKASIWALMLAGLVSMLLFPVLLISAETTQDTTTQQESPWQTVLSFVRRKKDRPGSRPQGQQNVPCLIAPNDDQNVIYSTRPLFLWKGNLNKIAVGNLGSPNYFWSEEIRGQKSFVTYAAKDELQPGLPYEWEVFIDEKSVELIPFQVMDAQQRQVVSDELKTLETRLQAKSANKEAVALERAKYFAQKELWADVLQEAYSVPNPSAELSQILQDLPDKLCDEQETEVPPKQINKSPN